MLQLHLKSQSLKMSFYSFSCYQMQVYVSAHILEAAMVYEDSETRMDILWAYLKEGKDSTSQIQKQEWTFCGLIYI